MCNWRDLAVKLIMNKLYCPHLECCQCWHCSWPWVHPWSPPPRGQSPSWWPSSSQCPDHPGSWTSWSPWESPGSHQTCTTGLHPHWPPRPGCHSWWSSSSFHQPKGWKLEKVPFSFYPWCIQSELSLVKHGQKSKVKTVLKSSGSQLFKTDLLLIFDQGKNKLGLY